MAILLLIFSLKLINIPGELHSRNYGLDVVRFLAISMVWVMHSIQEIFHTTVPYFWYMAIGGVELFFSLSGFLIGRMLLSIFSDPDFSGADVVRFWVRRWFRILPLYYTLYLVYLVVYNLMLYPVGFDLRYILFLQNIFRTPVFFGESWSLSIEEWFYLSVPVVICLLHGFWYFFRSKLGAAQAFLGTAIGLIWSMLLFRHVVADSVDNQAVIFRMDAVAYGMIAAYLSTIVRRISKRRAAALFALGTLVWLVAAILKMLPDIDARLRMLYYPVCGTGTSLIVFAGYGYAFRTKLRFVSYVSIISYSIYLIHLSGILIPLSAVTRGLGTAAATFVWLGSFPVIFIISSLSYRYIELPFLRMRDRFSIRQKS